MFKLAKEWVLSMDAVFALITGYSIMEAIPLIYILAYEGFDVKIFTSLFATVLASVYWFFRLLEWFVLKKNRRGIEDLKKRNLEIENEILEEQIIKKRQEKELREMEIRLTKKMLNDNEQNNAV